MLKAENGTKFIYRLKPEVQFLKVESECFDLNLRMLESRLPELLAFILYHQYKTGVSKTSELLELLKQANPMNFKLHGGWYFYESRFIRLFTASLSGMLPDTVWEGDDYMMYYLKDSHQFLLNNSQFDILPAEQSGSFLKLILQISFTANAQHQI
nr:HpaII family restriction endonuclease [Mucilaginibacter rivuli]